MRAIRTNSRGAAMVEFAIVAILLIILVFGIIEFGLLIKDYLTLNQAVREGVRSAALGGSIATITNTVEQSATTLDIDRLSNIRAWHRRRINGVWESTWTEGTPDSIPISEEVQVKVSAAYAHDMATGTLFGAGPISVGAEMVMRRE